ncbi:putative reverse transcriptase domain-containing protein [Tanacetum coccineum]|uniref:Reverse transcriptase domain-containing protein n=1 Tax=Tanacetum coccineum TaxID=301880 RepID=A0ABQ4XIS9_9ASTR
MLRACVLDFGRSWDVHLSLVEFSYNNSCHSSVRCASFEALYGRKCYSPIMWAEVGECQLIGPEEVQETTEKISQIKDRLKAVGQMVKREQDSVMSDSDESGVTHTEVSSPFEDLSDIGSPRADDHELLELPYIPEDPYFEAALQAPPSPDYVPGPEHDDDEIVAEDQPYAEDASPIATRDGGRRLVDIEEDEDDDMDIEADEEDEDDEMDVEIDEEEHLAPAYPVVVALPATAPSAEETEPFETDESAATPPPHPAYRMTARISIPEPLPIKHG